MKICQHYFPSLKRVCLTIDITFHLSLEITTINSGSIYVYSIDGMIKLELSFHHLSDKFAGQRFMQPIRVSLLWSPGKKLQLISWALPQTFMLLELTATTAIRWHILKLPYPQQCILCAGYFQYKGMNYLVTMDQYSNWTIINRAQDGSKGFVEVI